MKNLKSIGYQKVNLRSGFWKKWQDTVASATVDAVYEQFAASGRVEAMTHTWREGKPQKPHIFYDSDIAKWMEGAAYTLKSYPNCELEDKIDALVNLIEDGMTPEGYFNSYYQTVEFSNRWTVRVNHELYCAGHLIEAAVAYYEATGKRKFLDLMCRMADLIEEVFTAEGETNFVTPGHEEIELALMRLADATGERRYLELARHFIEERGRHKEDGFDFFRYDKRYAQDQAPVREQTTAEGHVVRFGYLFTGACDVAREFGDEELLAACKRVFNNVVSEKMYVTGGVGNMSHGEAFGPGYLLPNFQAYTETCASLAMAFFARRLLNCEPDSRYADHMELQLYNGALAGISLDGTSFFYENPLEQKPSDLQLMHEVGASGRPAERLRLFGCSCCPPNIERTIASIGEYFFSTDGKNTLWTHLYGDLSAEAFLDGQKVRIRQATRYPDDGKVTVTLSAKKPFRATLAFRIPGWCDDWSMTVSGEAPTRIEAGYAYFEREWTPGDKILIKFAMKPVLLEADPRVYADCGKVALKYGPLVYCLEECDNGKNLNDIRISAKPGWKATYEPELLNGVTAIEFTGTRRAGEFKELYRVWSPEREKEERFRAIPYYAWCNRGEGEMAVWIQR